MLELVMKTFLFRFADAFSLDDRRRKENYQHFEMKLPGERSDAPFAADPAIRKAQSFAAFITKLELPNTCD